MISFCFLVVVFSHVGTIFAVFPNPNAPPYYPRASHQDSPSVSHNQPPAAVPYPQAHHYTSHGVVPDQQQNQYHYYPAQHLSSTGQRWYGQPQASFVNDPYNPLPVNELLQHNAQDVQVPYTIHRHPSHLPQHHAEHPQLQARQADQSGKNLLSMPSPFKQYRAPDQALRLRNAPTALRNPTPMHSQHQQHVPASLKPLQPIDPFCNRQEYFETRPLTWGVDMEQLIDPSRKRHSKQRNAEWLKQKHADMPIRGVSECGDDKTHLHPSPEQFSSGPLQDMRSRRKECDLCQELPTLHTGKTNFVGEIVGVFHFDYYGKDAVLLLHKYHLQHSYKSHCDSKQVEIGKTQWTRDMCEQLRNSMTVHHRSSDLCGMINDLIKPQNRAWHDIQEHYKGNQENLRFTMQLDHVVGHGLQNQDQKWIRLIISRQAACMSFIVKSLYPMD